MAAALSRLLLLLSLSSACLAQLPLDPTAPKPDFQPDALHLRRSLYVDHLDAGTPAAPRDPCMIREGCFGGWGNRTVVRFGTAIWNRGAGDAVLGLPPEDCTPDMPEWWEFDLCHQHFHYQGYAKYQLYKGNDAVAVGHKMGFCLEDSFCPPGTDGKFNCAWQGVTSGCGDLYGDNLACQWIDVTDYVLSRSFDPEAELTLTVRVNSDRRFPEEDYDNNVAEARFRMSELERRATDTWSKPRHGPVPPGCRALDAQGRP